MEATLSEGEYDMFGRMLEDGSVIEARLQLVIEEEMAVGKLPPSFEAGEILITNSVKEAPSRQIAASAADAN